MFLLRVWIDVNSVVFLFNKFIKDLVFCELISCNFFLSNMVSEDSCFICFISVCVNWFVCLVMLVFFWLVMSFVVYYLVLKILFFSFVILLVSILGLILYLLFWIVCLRWLILFWFIGVFEFFFWIWLSCWVDCVNDIEFWCGIDVVCVVCVDVCCGDCCVWFCCVIFLLLMGVFGNLLFILLIVIISFYYFFVFVKCIGFLVNFFS